MSKFIHPPSPPKSTILEFPISSPMPDTAAVLEALSAVKDHEFQKNLVELNMIRQVEVRDGKVSFDLVFSTPSFPLRGMVPDDCRKALAKLDGVQEVNINVITDIPQQKAIEGRVGIEGVKNIIAITSGKGGVGKSTVSANVAVALAQSGAKVGLLDADIYGPNAPIMFGLAGTRAVMPEGGGLVPPMDHGVKLISMSFFVDADQPLPWRGPMLNGVIRQFLYEVAWGELDYLIVDLPPGTGDAQLTLAQAVPMAGAVIVTTPQAVAIADARKGLRMFEKFAPILGVIENMSYFIPPDMPDRQYPIFGTDGGKNFAAELQVPLLGEIPLEIPVRAGGDAGQPIVIGSPESAAAQALIATARAIATRVSVLALA
jgi:ATP-binding protein involved in chromosome partitioning